ncbi:MAG: hypothetical protein KC912_07610 [Proteobacteria bacterium]|nr:hypothetical protein [Pseudomonadota bacterium]
MSIVDQYCPDAHSAAVTAAAFDPDSGARVTADAWGIVAITKPHDLSPSHIFQSWAAVYGSVAVSPGGSLAGVGDESGSVSVYKTWDGTCVFEDVREGADGAARAMRALSFNPQGTLLACLAIDGIIRVYDIARWERMANWSGYSGQSINFAPDGKYLLVIDNLNQPKLIDMMSHEQVDLEMVPGGVTVARFTPSGDHIVAMGPGGITLIGMPEGRIVTSFTARGSSGMLSMVLSPRGDEVAAITERSIHTFSLPDLQPVGSTKHGAPEATQAALWDRKGVAVGGADGSLYRPGERASLEAVTACTGFGDHRAAIHGEKVAIWTKDRQRRPFSAKKRFVETKIDRDGRLLIGLPDDGSGMQVFDAKSGRHLFDAGPETADTTKMEVGGPIVACMLQRGGMRWYDLKDNQVFELDWATHFALSGGGTWIGVITPKGNVRIIDPATGKDAIPAPEPVADIPVSLVSFVNRRPDLLVMDEEGVLSIYDLAVSVKEDRPAVGEDVLDLNVAVDRLWGITGGRYAAVRFQEEDDTATIIFVDLERGEVVSETPGLLPYVWVDPETGHILQPARGSAIQEFDMWGKERRVLRALPGGHWVSFGPQGIFDASTGVEL